jgi:hypothetical protein
MNYKEMNIKAAELTCSKIQKCFHYIFRTFPSEVLNQSNHESCVKNIIIDLDEKIKNHDDTVQLHARRCYQNIANSTCEALVLLPIFDLDCGNLSRALEKF